MNVCLCAEAQRTQADHIHSSSFCSVLDSRRISHLRVDQSLFHLRQTISSTFYANQRMTTSETENGRRRKMMMIWSNWCFGFVSSLGCCRSFSLLLRLFFLLVLFLFFFFIREWTEKRIVRWFRRNTTIVQRLRLRLPCPSSLRLNVCFGFRGSRACAHIFFFIRFFYSVLFFFSCRLPTSFSSLFRIIFVCR